MNAIGDMCREVLSVARGDERDGAEIRDHLTRCQECRSEVEAIHQLTLLARAALAADPAGVGFSHETLRRARRRPGLNPWILRGFVGATAAVAAALILWIGQPSFSPEPTPLMVEFPPSADGSLHYVVTGPEGSRDGELAVASVYVLDTIPTDPILMDTF